MITNITEADRRNLTVEAGQCPNCGAARAGEFCSDCGQQRTRPEQLTIGYFLKSTFREFTELDSKIYRTLTALLFQPGRLTVEYLADRKERYVSPVKLYLLISAIFFLLAWDAMLDLSNFQQEMLANPAFKTIPQPRNVEQSIFFEQWFAKAGDYSAFTRFASVIGLGLGLALLYVTRGRFYVEHLIFAFHYYAFDFAFFSLLILPLKILDVMLGLRAPPWILQAGSLVLLWYSFVALRRVYRESLSKTLLKSLALLGFDIVLSLLGTTAAMVMAYAVVYLSLKH